MKHIPYASIFAFFALAIVLLLSRWMPHLSNVSATGAILLLAGAAVRPRWTALLMSLGLLAISDWVLGFYPGWIFNYAAWAMIIWGASLWLSSPGSQSVVGKWIRRMGVTLTSAVVFFMVSNFGVWVSTAMYPDTFAGLQSCYIMAIPFLARQCLGDLLYVGFFFAVWDWARQTAPRAFSLQSEKPDQPLAQ